MRRRSRNTLAPAVIALTLVLAPVAAAQSTDAEGFFKGGTIRPQASTCAGVLCGTGSLEPFGSASFVYSPTTFEQVSRSCFDVTAVLHITLTEGGDTLDLATDSTACFPGNSPNTPRSPSSWGNPVTDSGTWTVASGSGIFAGATGEGTFNARAAGAALSAHLSGELQLEES